MSSQTGPGVDPTGRERLARYAALAAFIVPLGLLITSIYAVVRTYVPIPFWDEWQTVAEWRQYDQGGLTLAALAAQHNEHRILLPRLVFLADRMFFGARDILPLAAIWGMQLVGGLFFLKLAWPRRGDPLVLLWLALSLGLLFSLIQGENFVWGFQVQFVGVFALAAWAIHLFVLAGDPDGRRGRPWALAGAIALAAAATFTLSSGLFVGLAMVGVGLLARRPWPPIAAVALATAGLAALYLHGYQPVATHSPPGYTLAHPGEYLLYVLAYLGGLLGHMGQQLPLAIFAGVIGVVATLAMAVMVIRGEARDATRLTLVGVALLIGMTAAVTAFGRVSLGLGQALSSRYVTPDVYFWAAQALFWALTWRQTHKATLMVVLASAMTLGLLVLIPWQIASIRDVVVRRPGLLWSQSALLSGDNDLAAIRTVYWDPAAAIDLAGYLRARRLSLFADDPGTPIGAAFDPAPRRDGACDGDFERLYTGPGGFLRAVGWSWTPAAQRPLDRLVLVDATDRVVGVGVGGAARPEVRAKHPGVTGVDTGWLASVTRGAVGPISAYGLLPGGGSCLIGVRG